MTLSSPAAADVLATGLKNLVDVAYVPLHDRVAFLDTSAPEWILYLDSDSPPMDHCWAMLDVLRVLTLGADAAESAVAVRRLRLVEPEPPA